MTRLNSPMAPSHMAPSSMAPGSAAPPVLTPSLVAPRLLDAQAGAPRHAPWHDRRHDRLRDRVAALVRIAKTLRNCAHDSWRYLRLSGVAGDMGGARHAVSRAHLMMDTHRLEKGLALPCPRPGFGAGAMARLMARLPSHQARFGPDFATRWCLQVLQACLRFNEAQGHEMAQLRTFLTRFPPPHPETLAETRPETGAEPGGVLLLRADQVTDPATMGFADLTRARHSLRRFAARPVDPALIARAAALAVRTPSVCNRQTGRLHHLGDPAQIHRVLQIQGGARGFGQEVPAVLIVTADLAGFLSGAERHQAWIDGGLFAMTTVYALQSLGLGSCMLNWSVDPSRDRALRRVVDLPRSEVVICLVALGHMPEDPAVARSPRLPPEAVLRSH